MARQRADTHRRQRGQGSKVFPVRSHGPLCRQLPERAFPGTHRGKGDTVMRGRVVKGYHGGGGGMKRNFGMGL
eukprot:3166965-Prorocentrum_lima.AAC.1